MFVIVLFIGHYSSNWTLRYQYSQVPATFPSTLMARIAERFAAAGRARRGYAERA